MIPTKTSALNPHLRSGFLLEYFKYVVHGDLTPAEKCHETDWKESVYQCEYLNSV